MDSKQAHAGEYAYDENFYRKQRELCQRYSSVILPVVSEYIHPRNVIDVGCALGGWLEFWQKNFGAEIYGIDGDYVDRSQLFIDEKDFHPANLEERINLNRRFDLAMTIEVAEHLSPARADSFVEDLTRLSDVILFSAAAPATGGVNHVNEQWQSYWAQKFLRLGYVAVDCIRSRIWTDNRISDIRKQTAFIYVKSTELYRYPELNEFYLKHRDTLIYDLIHLLVFANRLIKLKNTCEQLQKDYIQLQTYLEKTIRTKD